MAKVIKTKMKFILSSARNMKNTVTDIACTTPLFTKEAAVLLENLKRYTPWELETILKTNEKIASQTFGDILEFDFANHGTPAIFAYNGLAYKYLEPYSLSKSAIERSQSSMRILSAFYGLLRPLDSILPYRLEMRSGLKINGKSLYDFWGDKLYNFLFQDKSCIVNLASEEYAGIVKKYLQSDDLFIDIVFQAVVRGRRQTVTTMAKMARGQMARYILENNIDTPESLKSFEQNGLEYVESLSSPNRYVFLLRD